MFNRLAVFVPAFPTAPIATIVARGSAIVGFVGGDGVGRITVDYEGAIYGQANIKTYADRALHAAGRHLQNYPTVARAVVRRSELLQVGWFDLGRGITLLDDAEEAAASWLEVDVVDQAELHFSGPAPRSPWSLTDGFLP